MRPTVIHKPGNRVLLGKVGSDFLNHRTSEIGRKRQPTLTPEVGDLNARTPDEIYFGTGGHIPCELDSRRKAARAARLEANRAASCENCERTREAS
jgi:hypothetical protein